MANVFKEFWENFKRKRADAERRRQREAERVARIKNNIAKLKSADWKERRSAAAEGAESLSCWWDQNYYNHLLPVIFDENSRVREAALKSLGDMILEDHRMYAPPVLLWGGTSMRDLGSHFSEGQNRWKNSPYYSINRKMVDDIQKLLKTESDPDVINEANKTLDLARSYLK